MQKHLVLTVFGLAAGFLLLAWVEPMTNGGATLLVVLSMLVFNALGTTLSAVVRLGTPKIPGATVPKPAAEEPKRPRKGPSKAKKLAALLIPLAVLSAARGLAQPAERTTDGRSVDFGKAFETAGAAASAVRAAREAMARTGPSEAARRVDSIAYTVRSLPELPGKQDALAALSSARTAAAGGDVRGADRELLKAESLIGTVRVEALARLPTRGQAPVANAPPSVNPPPPTTVPTWVGSQPPAARRPLHPARVFLRAADIPPPQVGAYGVLALRAKPTPATQARLKAACAAFLASLPAQESLPEAVPIQDRMLTVWPLATAGAPDAKLDDCDHLLQNYDLHGGLSAIQDADRQGNALSGQGPYLIGWSPANSRRAKDAVVLVLDLSPFDGQRSFDEMFLLWQRRIVEDPALWRTGFSSERLRLVVRDFVDRYGQAIVDGLRLVRTGG